MRFRTTPLENELAGLPPEQAHAKLCEKWKLFRGSEHFDFVAYILRDLESQSLETLRQNPTKAPTAHLMVMHVVDRIRKTFESLDRGPGEQEVDWYDDEEFMPAEHEAPGRSES